MKEDSELVRKAMKCAGQYIHKVSNIIQSYSNNIYVANNGQKDNRELLNKIEEQEKELRIFVGTGKISAGK